MENNKDFSEVLNKYRIFPRVFSLLFIMLLWKTTAWFMEMDNPSVEQAGFASTMVATAAAFFKFYVQSGKPPNPE